MSAPVAPVCACADDREAVVAYLRRKAGNYTLSLKYAALMEAGFPLHATLPSKE